MLTNAYCRKEIYEDKQKFTQFISNQKWEPNLIVRKTYRQIQGLGITPHKKLRDE